MVRLVPPTDTTYGDAAGHSTAPPVSPDDATNVTPAYALCRTSRCRCGNRSTTRCRRHRDDVRMARRVVHRGHQVAGVGRGRLDEQDVGLGRLASAHSTSSEISSAQPPLAVGSAVVDPVWLTTVKLPLPVVPGFGTPYSLSKVVRSLLMYGSL